MQFFFSEFKADYSKYHFPYQVILKMEYGDDIHRIYGSGFLPFRSKKNLYYLARSTRVNLAEYEASSENRRILRKMEYLTYSVEPLEQFEYTGNVQAFCAHSAKEIGKGTAIMPTSAIRTIFTGKGNATHVMRFWNKETNEIVGYVAVCVYPNLVHYAHPFSQAENADGNLNIGMMSLAVEWAQLQHKQFVYLGTCYSKGAMYKAQFKGFQFFDGINWSADMTYLQALIEKSADTHIIEDTKMQQFTGNIDLDSVTSQVRVRMK